MELDTVHCYAEFPNAKCCCSEFCCAKRQFSEYRNAGRCCPEYRCAEGCNTSVRMHSVIMLSVAMLYVIL